MAPASIAQWAAATWYGFGWRDSSVPVGTRIRQVSGKVSPYPYTYLVSELHPRSFGTTGITYSAICSWYGLGFDEARIDGLGNVIGRVGSGKRVIAFDGHIDTVEVGNAANWKFDPFCGEIRDGFVHVGEKLEDDPHNPQHIVTRSGLGYMMPASDGSTSD